MQRNGMLQNYLCYHVWPQTFITKSYALTMADEYMFPFRYKLVSEMIYFKIISIMTHQRTTGVFAND